MNREAAVHVSDTREPSLPPVLSRLLRGSFWLALRSPLQAVLAFWSIPLTISYIGPDAFGAYGFAWGFGFIQFLLEFGMSSALQRQVSDAWTRGDRASVNRTIACGTAFYCVISALQAATLALIAFGAVPHAGYQGSSARLIVQLLILQAIVAPAYGLSAVATSAIQAARRYEFLPRLELAVVILRFLILVGGIHARLNFVLIVVAQVAVQLAFLLVPALVVMVRELGFIPHFRGATWKDLRALMSMSLYLFLIQLSVVLADRIDTTILGFALPDGVAGPATAVYQVISKPFLQIRQTGWTLSYLVLPAVASLTAARDVAALERIKYDGSRLLIGLLLPVGILAALDAKPFLELWVGPAFSQHAGLLRLFLVAALPLVVTVLVQAAIGQGLIRPIALAAVAGSLVNLPLSYFLTLRIGVAGVIWGTVLTTLVSNLLVPAIFTFRVLNVDFAHFLRRSLVPPLAGAAAVLGIAYLLRSSGWSPAIPAEGNFASRAWPLILDLSIGVLAYATGYCMTPMGRRDLRDFLGKLSLR